MCLRTTYESLVRSRMRTSLFDDVDVARAHLSLMLSGHKLEKLLINHEARFISWRIFTTSGKAVKPMPTLTLI